jgi:hypothetical protein
MSRLSGTIAVQVNGLVYDAVGEFNYNIGAPVREALVGHDRVHGYSELPQVPFIEGEIRDSKDFQLLDLLTVKDATVTLSVANGKTITLSQAWYAGEGTVGTESANIETRFEGLSAIEV